MSFLELFAQGVELVFVVAPSIDYSHIRILHS